MKIFIELHLQDRVHRDIADKSNEQYGDNRNCNYYHLDYSVEDLTNEKKPVGDYSGVSHNNYTETTYSTCPDKYHQLPYQKVV